MSLILGIDSSNYTTSVALLHMETGEILQQEKMLLPVKVGMIGLRQSDAVFYHTKQLPEVLERLHFRETFFNESLYAIGVSEKPRNMDGSYMPCFLAGLGVARSIAAITGVPLYRTSHQVGHILAALYSAEKLHIIAEEKPFLAFHVSGGTTDLLYCQSIETEERLKITLCATSSDLKAGQAVDRVGLQLGLSFPCGVELEKLALNATRTDYLKPVLHNGSCCLSGLENRCKTLLEQGDTPEEIAGYCLRSIEKTIAAMAQYALKKYGDLPILFAGGVMSNRLIRPALEKEISVCWFSEPMFSSDNAAGTAIYAKMMTQS